MRLVAIVLIIAMCFGFFIYLCDADDRARDKRELEWRNFSMQHHCSRTERAGFWGARDTWQCDGFQVEHQP